MARFECVRMATLLGFLAERASCSQVDDVSGMRVPETGVLRKYTAFHHACGCGHGPGPPGAVKRAQRFAMQIGFLWRFCMGVQGA